MIGSFSVERPTLQFDTLSVGFEPVLALTGAKQADRVVEMRQAVLVRCALEHLTSIVALHRVEVALTSIDADIADRILENAIVVAGTVGTQQ